MDELIANVAGNLKRRREARGLTLAQLAQRSGVSKSTLSQIEAATTNPTLGTLASLAGALGSSVEDLLSTETALAPVTVVRAGEGTDISDQAISGFLVASLPVEASVVEFHSLHVKPHQVEVSASHGHGAREHVMVVEGTIEVGPRAQPLTLTDGDYATYPADGPHLWQSGAGGARVWLAATYPAS